MCYDGENVGGVKVKRNYPQAYINYLIHFHGDRDYFECHEVLEEYWKEHTPMQRDSIWVGWIQLAVALYHQRRKNYSGAAKTIDKALSKFRKNEDLIYEFGIDQKEFLLQLQTVKAAIHSETPYKSFTLAINDQELLKQCQELCYEKGFQFGNKSDLSNNMLVDRHRLRDRQAIILYRQEQLNKRRGN